MASVVSSPLQKYPGDEQFAMVSLLTQMPVRCQTESFLYSCDTCCTANLPGLGVGAGAGAGATTGAFGTDAGAGAGAGAGVGAGFSHTQRR